jgi:hypothetical protein
VLSRYSGEDVIEFFSATQVSVKIFVQKPVRVVELDGQIQPHADSEQFAELRIIPGEHRVRINY